MALREAFTEESLQRAMRGTNSRPLKIIPTRRGSVVLAAKRKTEYDLNPKKDTNKPIPEDLVIVKIADMKVEETEKGIKPARSEGLSNENQILASIDGHGIAPGIYYYTEERRNHLIYAAYEYIESKNFDDYENADSVRRFCRSLIGAVTHLHEQGFIHGDIQPDNILWAPNNKQHKLDTTLIDFENSKPIKGQIANYPGLYLVLSPEAAFELKHDIRNNGTITMDQAEETFNVAATILSIIKGTRSPIEFPRKAKRRHQRLKYIINGTYDNKYVNTDNLFLANTLCELLNAPKKDRPQKPSDLYTALQKHF